MCVGRSKSQGEVISEYRYLSSILLVCFLSDIEFISSIILSVESITFEYSARLVIFLLRDLASQNQLQRGRNPDIRRHYSLLEKWNIWIKSKSTEKINFRYFLSAFVARHQTYIYIYIYWKVPFSCKHRDTTHLLHRVHRKNMNEAFLSTSGSGWHVNEYSYTSSSSGGMGTSLRPRLMTKNPNQSISMG